MSKTTLGPKLGNLVGQFKKKSWASSITITFYVRLKLENVPITLEFKSLFNI